MYTGIVQDVRPVAAISRYPGGREISLSFTPALLADLAIGGSVSVEGVCLSVTRIEGDTVSFDAMNATLARTNLCRLTTGGRANVERSARPGEENGGHAIAGHIAATAELVAIETDLADAFICFRIAPEWAKYVFPRGFLAVNGCSLTVAEHEPGGPEGDLFRINLIPETLRQTTFRDYRVGDRLNIEVDHPTMVMVDTIERTLKSVLPEMVSGLLAGLVPAAAPAAARRMEEHA